MLFFVFQVKPSLTISLTLLLNAKCIVKSKDFRWGVCCPSQGSQFESTILYWIIHNLPVVSCSFCFAAIYWPLLYIDLCKLYMIVITIFMCPCYSSSSVSSYPFPVSSCWNSDVCSDMEKGICFDLYVLSLKVFSMYHLSRYSK